MKVHTFLKRLLALALVFAIAMPWVSALEFPDAKGHWAEPDVLRWTAAGIIKGYEDKTFRPDNPITRGEMATMLDRLLQFEKQGQNSFSDLEPNAFYYQPLLKAYDARIFLGDDMGRMRPKDYITRQEAVTALGRAFGVQATGNLERPRFSDYHQIADWAVGYVYEMATKAYVAGRPDGTFDPKANITRGEIVRVLTNICQGYFSTAGEYSENIAGTAVVNTPGITLKNMTIRGDLIIAEGVKDGEVTLDGVNVLGQVFVRGGGDNSLLVKGNSNMGTLHVGRTAGPLSVKIIPPAIVDTVTVAERSGNMTLHGTIKTMNVDAPLSKITTYRANIGQVNVRTAQGDLKVDNYSKVGQLNVSPAAENVNLILEGRVSDVSLSGKNAVVEVRGIVNTLTTAPQADNTKARVLAGGGVGTFDLSGSNAAISGDGRIEYVMVKGNNTTIQAVGSQIVVAPNVSGTTGRGNILSAGSSTKLEGNLPYAKDPETGDTLTGSITAVRIEPMTPFMNVGDKASLTAYASPSLGVGKDVFKWTSSNEQVGRVVSTSNTTADVMALAEGSFDITATAHDGSTGSFKIVVYSKDGVCYIGDNFYTSLYEAIDDADLSNQPSTIHLLPKFYDGKDVIRIGPTTNNQLITIVGTGKSSQKPYTGGFHITRSNLVLSDMNLSVSSAPAAVPAPATDRVPPLLAPGVPHPPTKPPAAGGDTAGIFIGADNVTVKNSTVDYKGANAGYGAYGIFVGEKPGDLKGYQNVVLLGNILGATNSGAGNLAYGIYSLSPSLEVSANTVTGYRALGMERLSAQTKVSGNLFNSTDYEVVYHGPDTFINSAVPGKFSTIFGGDKNLNPASLELLQNTTYQLRGSKKVLLANGTKYNTWEKFEYFDYANPLVVSSYYYNKGLKDITWELTDLAAFEAAKEALRLNIAKVGDAHDRAKEGTHIGFYPSPAKANLKKAQTAAQVVFSDATSTTSSLKAAHSTLDSAFAEFLAAEVKPTEAARFLTSSLQNIPSGGDITLATYPNMAFETVWLAPAGFQISDLTRTDASGTPISKTLRYNRTFLDGNAQQTKSMKAPIMPGSYKLYVVYNNQLVGLPSVHSVTVVKSAYPSNGRLPAVPTASNSSITDGSITLQVVQPPTPVDPNFPATVQYAKSLSTAPPTDDNGWQDSPTFDRLERDTDYYFFTRVKTTELHLASGPSRASNVIRTKKTDIVSFVPPNPSFELINGAPIQKPADSQSGIVTNPATQTLLPTWSIRTGSGPVNVGSPAVGGVDYIFTAIYAVPQGYSFKINPDAIPPVQGATVSVSETTITYTYVVKAQEARVTSLTTVPNVPTPPAVGSLLTGSVPSSENSVLITNPVVSSSRSPWIITDENNAPLPSTAVAEAGKQYRYSITYVFQFTQFDLNVTTTPSGAQIHIQNGPTQSTITFTFTVAPVVATP